MNTPRVEPTTFNHAMQIKRRYVCAACWSELIIISDPESKVLSLVICPNCSCPGYVTKGFAERQRLESAANAADAKHNLREAVPGLNPSAGKQVTELLSELGFN